MRRRECLTLLAGAAVPWTMAARAQPSESKRIGILMNIGADEPEGQARMAGFKAALRDLGWLEGSNAQVEARWAGDDQHRFLQASEDLVGLKPDVILASGSASVLALQQVTRSVPIVFVNVVDPVGAGLVASLARPRGNATGFISFEYSIAGKWLELLKQLSAQIARVAVVRDSSTAAGIGLFAVIQAAAASSAVELSVIDPRDSNELEPAFESFAQEPNGGVIVTAANSAMSHRESIIALATRHRLPSIFPFRFYVANGGLASYGPDSIDGFKRAAGYIDRILKGQKPSELPVQAPTKYELVVNLKTAKAMRLNVPPTWLAAADEVIE